VITRREHKLAALACSAGLWVGGCSMQPREVVVVTPPVLQEVPPAEWPRLEDDLDTASLVAACEQSQRYFARQPSDRQLVVAGRHYTAGELAAAMTRVIEIVEREPDPEARTAAFKQDFRLLSSIGRDGQGEVLLTGYYEPLLEARRAPEPPFEHPIYAVPNDLLTIDLRDFDLENPGRPLKGRVEGSKVVPYYDREAIDFERALEGKAEPLAYLSNLVDVFFLQIQGSGTLLFPSGERVRAGYASGNGRPYRSIGKLLLEESAMTLDEMSMQGIKRFLAANPDQVRRVLSHNPSYVFFRPLPPTGGPLGCYGIPLTAGRSIATDRRLFAAPVLAYIAGTKPNLDGEDGPFSRLVLNQDTGGAIRGPGRVDLFYGAGDEAGDVAGRTKHLGRLFFLLPKPAPAAAVPTSETTP